MSSWTPHIYQKEGNKRGYSLEYLDILRTEGMALTKTGLPVIFTLGHLAAITDVPFRYLHSVVSRRTDPYRVFRLRKRNGEYRIIVIPHPALLRTQRWIHQHILLKAKTHQGSTAYENGSSPYKNAEIHCGANWLVKIDIKRFFESISERQVYHVFLEMGYRPLLSFELARITTRLGPFSSRYNQQRWKSREGYRIVHYKCDRIGHLPQGAPTSPMLANLVCLVLDKNLSDLADSMNCVYTRYSDDIVFSSYVFNRDKAVELIQRCSGILRNHGFRKNIQKTHVVPPGARKVVTGLLVNETEPKLGRDFKDNLRCHLYFTAKHGIAEHCKRRGFRSLLGFRDHIKGLITYAKSIEPEFGEKCQSQFEKISWPPV